MTAQATFGSEHALSGALSPTRQTGDTISSAGFGHLPCVEMDDDLASDSIISFIDAMETMKIQDVQPKTMLDALMRRVVMTGVTLEKVEMAEALENIRENLHWAQENASSVVHLKCSDSARIVGVVLIKNLEFV